MFRLQIAVVTVALTAIASGASAQTSATASRSSADERADRMHDRAVALHARPDRMHEAVRLHRFEAKLRAPGDPRVFDCLTLASYLLVYSGRLRDARYVMEQAAKDALNRGDATMAAKAYVEVAFIAEKQQKWSDVRTFADRAKELSHAPGVALAQREAILSRLSYPLAAASVRN